MKMVIGKKSFKRRKRDKIKLIGIILAIIVALSITGYLVYISQEKELKYEVIAFGQYSGINKSIGEIINYEFQFEKLWDDSFYIINPKPKMPSINFKTSTLVAFYLGERPGIGWNIQIVNIIERYDRVVISIRQVPPVQNVNSQVKTNPYKIIKLEKIEKPIKFRVYD